MKKVAIVFALVLLAVATASSLAIAEEMTGKDVMNFIGRDNVHQRLVQAWRDLGETNGDKTKVRSIVSRVSDDFYGLTLLAMAQKNGGGVHRAPALSGENRTKADAEITKLLICEVRAACQAFGCRNTTELLRISKYNKPRSILVDSYIKNEEANGKDIGQIMADLFAGLLQGS